MSYPLARYKTGEPVMVGDHVEFKTWPELWLVKHQGRVVHVPGVSPVNSTLEDENLKWACIEFRGTKFGPLVHPETGILQGIRFLKRTDDELRSTPVDFSFPEGEQDHQESEQFR